MNESENLHEAMSLGEKIGEALSFKTVFSFEVAGMHVPVSESVVVSWVVMAVLAVGTFALTRGMAMRPNKRQAGMELLVGFFNGFCEEKIGHHWKSYAPYLFSVALYLLVANIIPIFSPVAGFGFEPLFEIKPPTRDINVTTAYALMTICIVFFSALRYKGPLGWAKSLLKPIPMMLPFNLLDYVIRPLTLSLRLFGNILGAFIIMRLVELVFPAILPGVFAMFFDLFDGTIQAVIFVFLSTLFIGEAIE